MIVAFGIDPGIAITGFALVTLDAGKYAVREYGVVRTPERTPLPSRLNTLFADISSLLARHHDIQVAGIEELFFAKNVKTAFMVGQARGVLLLALEQAKIPIYEYKPVEVKSLITGNGQAKKREVQRIIQLTFGMKALPQPDDAADAIAIAMVAAAQRAANPR